MIPVRAPTVEMELLREAARRCLDGRAPGGTPSFQWQSVNWSHVLWLGRRERVLLHLYEATHRGWLEIACPTEIQAQLEMLRRAAKFQAFNRMAAVCRLHDALTRAGVPFIVADDWMFQACFHPDLILVETTTAIRCIIRAVDWPGAQGALDRAGFPLADGHVQVTTRNQTPVELFTTAAPAAQFGAWPPPTAPGEIQCLPITKSRALRTLAPLEWLQMLSSPFAPPSLLREWQISCVAKRSAAGPHDGTSIQPGLKLTRATGSSNGAEASARRRPVSPETPRTCPFLPTPTTVVEQMLTIARVNADDILMDLGCGDGRVVIEAARRSGARAIGVDIDPTLLAIASDRALTAGVADRIELVCQDLFKADIRRATVIFVYVVPSFLPPLVRRLQAEGRPGLRIVSHNYPLPHLAPDKTELVRLGPGECAQVYLYHMKT